MTGDRLPLLERLGLHRPELRAWAMYEWATTGMWAVIVATIFPIYFQTVAAANLDGTTATQYFATATTLGIALVAIIAPILGAITDRAAIKKPMLGLFAAIGISGAGLLFFVQEGDWLMGLTFFVLSTSVSTARPSSTMRSFRTSRSRRKSTASQPVLSR
jgi:MFS transporter, UMF1 family